MTAPKRAVYRALIGGYEDLREEPVARESDLPFICFTDDPTLTSSTWEVVVVEPRLRLDRTRSSRALKIVGHPVLDEFDETLWVDNTVALQVAPDALFDDWLRDAEVAAPLHSYRSSVLAEAEAVIDSGLDDFSRVYEQLTHYLASGGDVLEQNPHWTGMLARRRTPATSEAMQAWWEDVLRYSRRDQLSFLPVMRAHDVGLRSVPLDALHSAWHEWPRAEGRDTQRLGSGLREALRPPPALIGELQQQLDAATQTLGVTVAQREDVITALEESLSESRALVDATRADLDTVRHERNLAHIELAASQARTAQLEATVRRKSAKIGRLRRQVRRLRTGSERPSGWRGRLGRNARPRWADSADRGAGSGSH